jgi:hypothetical protein
MSETMETLEHFLFGWQQGSQESGKSEAQKTIMTLAS